jgi:hypothetical protein
MGKGNRKNTYIEVVVLWGGSELGRLQKPLAKCSGVTAGKGLFTSIRSRVWPRWDALEILIWSKSGLILNPNVAWDGVITDSDGAHVLNSTRPQKKIIGISSQTSASLRLDEMSVLIRTGPRQATTTAIQKNKSKYRGSPLNFIADFKNEWISIGLAAIGAAIIMGSVWWSLENRTSKSYTNISDLPDKRILPFIAQSHLSTAPNIIQANLDRFNFIRSVWGFYSDLALTLGFGEDPGPKSPVFSSTVEYYQSLSAIQRGLFAGAESDQRQKLEAPKGRPPYLSIPTVKGESLDGRIVRTLDKISVIRDSSDELAQRRIKVAEEFEADVGYKFQPKRDEPTQQEAFAKISAGFMGVESDDKMQAKQALDSAARAALAQTQIFGRDRIRFGAIGCCEPPAGAPLTLDGLSWISPKFDADDFSSSSVLEAVAWDSPSSKSSVNLTTENKIGAMDPVLVEKTVNAGLQQIRMCYELALSKNQTVNGLMEWRWTIERDGRPSKLKLIRSSINDPDLMKCVQDKIASWRFPKPEGGVIEVRYPFKFTRA